MVGKPVYRAISAVPDGAVIEVIAEGPSGSIQNNKGAFSIETIAGAGNLLTVTATAKLDGEKLMKSTRLMLFNP